MSSTARCCGAAFRLDGGAATVFPEAAETEVAGLVRLHADPIAASPRLVA